MKKIILFFIAATAYTLSFAQLTTAKDLQVTSSLQLIKTKVIGISTDTSSILVRPNFLITEKAAKNYADQYRYVLGAGFLFSGDTVSVSPVLAGKVLAGTGLLQRNDSIIDNKFRDTTGGTYYPYGNVGIGANLKPLYKLDVKGFINIDELSSYNIGGKDIINYGKAGHNLIVGSGLRSSSWGQSSQFGERNTAVGDGAMQSFLSAYVSNFSDNTAIGYFAGANIDGSNTINNTYVGSFAGNSNGYGSGNTIIGANSTIGSLIGSNYNTILGANVINYSEFSNNIIIADGQGNQRINSDNVGNVGVNTGVTIESSAQLEVRSVTKGFLPPRMTAEEGSALNSPAEGLMIYVTDTNGTFTAKGWWGWEGSSWVKLNN
jgi:hypothetical protein